MRTAIAIAALWVTAAVAQDEVHTWTDESGEVHYTNDPSQVPAQYRRTMKRTAGDGALSVIPASAQGGDAKGSTQRAHASGTVRVQAGTSKPNLDETSWRSRFREARRKISALEEELREQKSAEAALWRSRAQASDGSLGDPRHEQVKRRIAEISRDLEDAHSELNSLNQAAAEANVPESWR